MLLGKSAWPLRPRGSQGAAPSLHIADGATFLSEMEKTGKFSTAVLFVSVTETLRTECMLSGQHKLENTNANSILNVPHPPSPVNLSPQDLAQDELQ